MAAVMVASTACVSAATSIICGILSAPASIELHRPWPFFFDFKDDPDSTEHAYGWTSLAQLRAGHHWVHANAMVKSKIALLVTFDGNFDVVASRRTGRIVIPATVPGTETVSCFTFVLDDVGDEDIQLIVQMKALQNALPKLKVG